MKIKEIVDDIECLVQFAQNDIKHGCPTNEVQEAASRVEAWLATYQPKHDL